MEHVAIDLGSRKSQICVRAQNGEILVEKQAATSELGAFLEARPKSRVVVESCAEAFMVADLAVTAGHEVRVVAATLVRALGVGARKTKTDKRDARTLSEVSCRIDLPSIHVASNSSRETKTMLGMRQALLASRTMLINTVRGWLRAQAVSIRKSAEAFVERVRNAVPSLPSYVERQLQMIDQLSAQIDAADKELARIAKAHAVCPRLMSTPGIGPITALQFVAVIDNPTRFKSAHNVEAYLGLTPGEFQSSEKQHRTSITKAGSARLRMYLIQAAWSARRARGSHPMIDWSTEVEKRRGKHVAVVALARKLAGILFALWRDGTLYNPCDAARKVTPAQAA